MAQVRSLQGGFSEVSRFIGVDVGAETLKVVEVVRRGDHLAWTRRARVDHGKDPGAALRRLFVEWDLGGARGASVTGRLSRAVNLPRVPQRQALARGFRHLRPEGPATLVSIGSHGFSVLEIRDSGVEVYRENTRCSQGTGNFLRQLVERFDLTVEEASVRCAREPQPAALSGRCPVILKTDMTHLANMGQDRVRILAGLFDAVAENVQVLLKPRTSPPRVILVGGVSQAPRIQDHFRTFLDRNGMALESLDDDDALFVEALGCALLATERPAALPALDDLVRPVEGGRLERLPPLSAAMHRVRRMEAPIPPTPAGDHTLILGLDIGSTGSKVVALDADTGETAWSAYTRTLGNPIQAAQDLVRQFVESPWAVHPVVGWGATGSGREIVGSLLISCFGPRTVHVVNEIAAHAEGALRFDPRVDTIFEIGGQDAKYIRLAGGRVVDAAMNEACSAGTGSFIEEQGRRFSDVEDVVAMGRGALAAPGGVSLGQHCSVFMAEIIDEAIGQGVPTNEVLSGIYDSIVQNYLNRVKGSRSVGQVIFCQGMPFAADALAAAVARQTGMEVVVPPAPGLTGALGIALLARTALTREGLLAGTGEGLDPRRFLEARIERRETFPCRSTKGCGGSGNKCRIDRIDTVVAGQHGRFTWGGACSLYDRGMGRQKLPDRAPDPFREVEEHVQDLIRTLSEPRGRPRVGMTDEFVLKGFFPFFLRFVRELGLDPQVRSCADHTTLKRGIEEANVPFCAPMQMYHGVVADLADDQPEYLLMPLLRDLGRVRDERYATVCPMVQGSPDVVRWDLGQVRSRLVIPTLDLGVGNLESDTFRQGCREMARLLGVEDERTVDAAWRAGLVEQSAYDAVRADLGRRALAFAREHGLLPVVVLGRHYTIYNKVLNSNVPAILREQGAMAIPVDCFPVETETPVFHRAYWAYGQLNLRAAHQIRRTPGIYSLWASNYACGPDSFNLHFYSYIMEGRPYAVIETDGHSGDAGTRTRVEAFLYCAREDHRRQEEASPRPKNFRAIEMANATMTDIRERKETVLVPRMGPGAETLAACLRGVGIPAEALPLGDAEALRLGRRNTSGKECVPMAITLGSLLQRLERERDTDNWFSFFMPTAHGPCRFGSYHLLHKVVLERLGWSDRVRVWSPEDNAYFKGVSPGFGALFFAAITALDLLLEGLYETRPREKTPGAAKRVYDAFISELHIRAEDESHRDISVKRVLAEIATRRLFGITDLLRRAGEAWAAVREHRELPTVLVVGEIYVRCDPFANGFVIDELEKRGVASRFAAFNEWLEYTDHLYRGTGGLDRRITGYIQDTIRAMNYQAIGSRLDWPARTSADQSVAAAAPYMRSDLHGETVLTIGGPVHEWRSGLIDGVLSVNPLECMPGKLAEAQLFHAAEQEGLLSLSLSLNGEPPDAEVLDSFAFEVRRRFASRGARSARSPIHRLLERVRSAPVQVEPPARPVRTETRREQAAK